MFYTHAVKTKILSGLIFTGEMSAAYSLNKVHQQFREDLVDFRTEHFIRVGVSTIFEFFSSQVVALDPDFNSLLNGIVLNPSRPKVVIFKLILNSV